MSTETPFYGPNVGYVLDLYEQYLEDPDSVDPVSRAYFASWTPQTVASLTTSPVYPVATRQITEDDLRRIVGAARLARFVRENGHMAARVDPLGTDPPGDDELGLEANHLTTADLTMLPASVVGGPCAVGSANCLEALGKLRKIYSGNVGYETDHIQVSEERKWLYEAIESRRFYQGFDDKRKRQLLERLTEVDTFEQFLDRATNKSKRFSIEGTDMLVPMMDEIIREAAAHGTQEVVIGMAHRGRLNVLAHVMGKPYEAILAGFEKPPTEDVYQVPSPERYTSAWTGDVKYHMGYQKTYKYANVREVQLTLAPNPSHLEYVNPVVEGRTRAAQDIRAQRGAPMQNIRNALAILVHGDAAFPGQGVVAETLNLCQLKGYKTGGTIHIILNNQVGFTTLPSDARSTIYAGDLAKGFEIPIVHVSADDPESCLAVALMAHAYREKFGKDFLIDLIGYRRYGHNEGDDPSITQPRMYEFIRAHPRIREKWAQELERQNIVTRDEAEAMLRHVEERLKQARNAANVQTGQNEIYDDMESSRSSHLRVPTSVEEAQLLALNEALLARPDGFTVSAKLEKSVIQKRRVAVKEPNGIDWAHAEALAFAAILADGTPIRLTGQDSERGTFAQRHAVLHDPMTGEIYVPLQHIPQARASFAIYNSPLSENAALGFEYGYSMHAPGVLVLWEAQFGDFVNGAQVIVDQFLVSGNAKWRQTPSLVLLLPHGYEGQGPEHSSARLERFLQLAATDNIRVVYPTTAAQYFHLLRRQAALLERDPRPLVVMTPKSLLRDVNASSSLADLTQGSFQTVLDDPRARQNPECITRLILCSGKVYMNLVYLKQTSPELRPDFAEATNVAAARVEELYPFPVDELRELIARYPNLREIVWLQEEPANMGAWQFVAPRLKDVEMVGWKGELTYCGRSEAASPAEGSSYRHFVEQERIIQRALHDVPELKIKASKVSQTR
jgi:2-oxoglutarate dehydrogenase E1 component